VFISVYLHALLCSVIGHMPGQSMGKDA